MPASLDDTEFTYSIRQDKARTKYMHQISGDIEQQRAWLKEQMARPRDYFFVVHTSSGIKIGTASIYNIKDDEGEVGRLILNGNNIQNMEAIIMLYEFAFFTLKLSKLRAEIVNGNTASIRITQTVGGKEITKSYSSEFNNYMVSYEVLKESYLVKRHFFIELINRFGNRE